MRMVARRWAMTKVVRPRIAASTAAWTCRSVSASSALVASSSTMIGGSLRSARAIDRRCRSPPERLRPRSPTTVLRPFGARRDEIHRLRRLERPLHLGGRRVGLADAQVLLDRAGEDERLLEHHADILAQRFRASSCGCRARRSSPAPVGSNTRCSRFSVVDLPEPVAPTRAIVSPACASKRTSASASRRLVVGEGHVLEPHIADEPPDRDRVGRVADVGLRVHHIEEHPDAAATGSACS